MRRRTKFILLGVYYIAAATVGVLIAVYSKPFCVHDECLAKASLIQSKLLRKVDPCKDFYRFVCGAQPQKLPSVYWNNSKAKDRWNIEAEPIYTYLVDKIKNYKKDLKNGDFYSSDILYHETMISELKDICFRLNFDNEKKPGLENHVRQRLVFAMGDSGMHVSDLYTDDYNRSFTVGMLEHNLRIQGFPGKQLFDATIQIDSSTPDNRPAMFIKKPNMFMIYPKETIDTQAEKVLKYVYKGLSNFFVPSTPDVTVTEGLYDNVIKFWKQMSDWSVVKETPGLKKRNVTIDELHRWFPDLDFKGFIKLMGAEKEITYAYICGDALAYYDLLRKELGKHLFSSQVLMHYLLLNTFMSVAPFTLVQEDDNRVSIDYSYFSQQYTQSSRAEICERYFPLLDDSGMLESLSIERFNVVRHPPDFVNKTLVGFHKIMKDMLMKSRWMDSATKKSAVDKLSTMQAQISLDQNIFFDINTRAKREEYFNGLCIQKTVYETLMCINAFFTQKTFSLPTRTISGFDLMHSIKFAYLTYYQDKNAFYAPIYVLRTPAFYSYWPKHINFGGLAVDMAAELIKGFNLEGSMYDMFGVKRDWWSNSTMLNYKKMEVECAKALKPVEKTPINTDINTLTPQNLTNGNLQKSFWRRLIGLRMAYEAYKEEKRTSFRGTEKLLPGFDGYSYEQMFFLSHTHMLCLPYWVPDETMKQMRMYFKSIGTLKEFQETFHCSSTPRDRISSAMSAATKKCLLF